MGEVNISLIMACSCFTTVAAAVYGELRQPKFTSAEAPTGPPSRRQVAGLGHSAGEPGLFC